MQVIKIRSTKKDNHIHLTVFMGKEGQTMVNCGTLIFEIGEWQLFGALLHIGAETAAKSTGMKLITEGWMPEAEG